MSLDADAHSATPTIPTAWTKADLTRELTAALGDLDRIVNAIYKEAVKRGWCGDYEVFVRYHNPRLSKPRLIPRDWSREQAQAALANVVIGCNCEACERGRRTAREAGLL